MRISVDPTQWWGAKWLVTHEEYAADEYPTYCDGPFYIFTSEIVAKVLRVIQPDVTKYLKFEDVFLTGILRSATEVGVESELFKELHSNKDVEMKNVFTHVMDETKPLITDYWTEIALKGEIIPLWTNLTI